MKIKFINHASFLLESMGVGLLCDPWTQGKAFNDAWSLLSPSADVPYDRIDYIWISHEHPDHFSLPTLRSIPEAHRRRITILYQRHSSPRLVDAFHKLGFDRVQELPLYRWFSLRQGFDVLCGSVGSMDSFLAIRSDNECVLNLNDCTCTPAQTYYIRRLVGKVSVLFTQFSFANWIGNHADQIGAVRSKLDDLALQVKIYKPEFTVPFASFIYFCRQENSWMNELMISPERIATLNLPGVKFMYPGHEWDSHSRLFRSEEAIAAYTQDISNIKIDTTSPAVEPERVQDAVLKMLSALHKRFGKSITGRIQPFDIYLPDVDRVCSVFPGDCRCTIHESDPELASRARYVMGSQVAWYTFNHTWGWGTLQVSGLYLDREFETKGPDRRLSFWINMLSTDYITFSNATRVGRTARFLWDKKFELLYRFLPGRQRLPSSLGFLG